MELTFKRRKNELAGWDVFSTEEYPLFTVQSHSLWSWNLSIYNSDGMEVGSLKSRFLSFQYAYELFVNELPIGTLKLHSAFSKPFFTLDYLDWRIEGSTWNNIWYAYDKDGNLIMEINREVHTFSYSYVAEILYPEHALFCTFIVLTIQATYQK